MLKRFLILLTLLFFSGTTTPSRGSDALWLLVRAAHSSAAEITGQAKQFWREVPNGLMVQMSDCGRPEKGIAWVAEALPSRQAAAAALTRLGKQLGHMRIEPCTVRPGTLLWTGISAVDPSMAEAPSWAADDWSDADFLSLVHPLPDGRNLLIIRHYNPEDMGPYLGWSEGLVLVFPDRSRVTLDNHCRHPGGIATRGGLLALHCAEEAAAHIPLHAVHLFDPQGKRFGHIRRCRDPRFASDRTILCQKESVTYDATVELRSKRVDLLTSEMPWATLERHWLVILASDPSPIGISRKDKLYNGWTVQMRDCGEARDMFAVAWLAEWRDEAEARLAEAREIVSDAYIKPCDLRPASLLNLYASAVHPSIAELPRDAETWPPEKLVSSVHRLPDGRIIMIERSVTDPGEQPPTVQESVSFDPLDNAIPQMLLEDCPQPGGFTADGPFVAFQCWRGQSGEHVLHRIFVYTEEGERLAFVDRCRDPAFTGDHVISCQAESITADGELQLESRSVRFEEYCPGTAFCPSSGGSW